MIIRNLTKNALLADKVVIANAPFGRMKGLLGRSVFGPGEALIIAPCQSVHMLFMKFAIDVIFLDRYKRVLGACSNLKPFGFSPVFWKSACAIEVPAGTIEKTNTEIGDDLTWDLPIN